MSLVVSDSGALHYLVLCEAIEVVPKLYGQLVIPSAVARELTHEHTPPVVRRWIKRRLNGPEYRALRKRIQRRNWDWVNAKRLRSPSNSKRPNS